MIDTSKFKDIFIMEAEEHVQKINDNILLLEKSLDNPEGQSEVDRLLNELMRSSHTIKGSSASMAYTKLAFLTHVMEDIFDTARNGSLELNQPIINKIFESIDLIGKSIDSIKKNNVEIDTDVFANNLKTLTGVATEGVGKSLGKSAANQAPSNAPPKKQESIAKDMNEEVIEAIKINYIKVPVERLETLIGLVEELLIDKMRLEQLAIKNSEVRDLSGHISLLVSGIQFQVMQARLVPVEQVFARFPRMVRDLAQKQGKKINLTMVGSELELDRTIIDKVGDLLIHLLRNAVDHGINQAGNITVKAVRESANALFIVENDDQGINYEKVREAAVKRGIVNSEDIKNYNHDQLVSLLFHPRLSTRDVVTEISGRGIGLSVVKNFVDMLNGRVVVEDLNPGVRFKLILPLTLAIINALLVKIGDSIFAIPFTNVERSVIINRGNIKKMADRDVGIVDGVNLPLVKFSQIFDQSNTDLDDTVLNEESVKCKFTSLKTSFENNNNGDMSALSVIVKKENNNIGLIVDKLINVQEIIIKPLSPILRGIKGFSGSTILGDGRVVLIIDVANLIQYANN
jgi:two-component system, chemotaxis family, sensor kinase CheA